MKVTQNPEWLAITPKTLQKMPPISFYIKPLLFFLVMKEVIIKFCVLISQTFLVGMGKIRR